MIERATGIQARRHKASETLRDSYEQFRIMADNLPLIIWVHDAEGRQQFVNETFCNYFGVARDEMRRERWKVLTHPEDGPAYAAEFAAAVREQRAFHGQVRVRRADGEWRWLESWGRPRFSARGEFLGHVGTSLDITERKLAAEALARRTHQQQAVYQLTYQLHRSKSLDDVFKAALQATRDALQCQKAAILLFDSSDVMRFVAWEGLSDEYRAAVEGHSPWQADARNHQPVCINDIDSADLAVPLKYVIRRESIAALAFIPLLSNGNLIGKFMAYFETPHDFTPNELELGMAIGRQFAFSIEQQKMEQALRESEQRLQQTISIETVGVLFFNLKGEMVDANNAFQRMSGYTADELRQAVHWQMLTAPEFMEVTQRTAKNLEEQGEAPPYEKVMIRKDGSRWWGLFAPTRLRGSSSECVEFIIDITERKRAEDQLRESQERFRNLADHSPVIIWVTGPDNQCTYLNQSWYDFTGQQPGAGLGNGWIDAMHPKDRETSQRIFIPAKAAREPFELEYRLRRHDGEMRWFKVTARPRFDSAGDFLGYIGSVVDIDDEKRLTEKLERTVEERTAELRETNEQLEAFVYSIAHDLRGPLRSMAGFAQVLLDDYTTRIDETGQQLLKRIEASAGLMDRLILDLLAFGRTAQAKIELAPVAVEAAWESALEQCDMQIAQTNAHIETVRPLPIVEAHDATLSQCLANLLSNSLKFVAPNTQPHIRFWANKNGNMIRLCLQDNGIGIAADQHERIFRVFERVHGSRYPGTGIGLSIVRKGVERMRGTMGLKSEPGKGSLFWIELPKAEKV